MRHTSVRRVAVAIAAVLVLAGCGSGDDGEPDTAATTAPEEPTEDDTADGAATTAEEEPGPLDGTTADEPVGADGSFAEAPSADGTSAAPPAPDGVDAVEAADDPSIGLASAGLIVLDGERLVDGLGFPAPETDVLDVLEVVTDERPEADTLPPECDGGTTRTYDDLALTVTFVDGVLTGWFVNSGDAPRTINDVGIGSTLAEFRAAIPSTELVEGSSLGDEFTTDAGYSGVLSSGDEDGTVDGLWAGDVCTIR